MGKSEEDDKFDIELKVMPENSAEKARRQALFERLTTKVQDDQVQQASSTLGQWNQLMANRKDSMPENSLSNQRRHIIATHNQILKKTFRKLREETKRVGLNSKLWRCSTANKNFSLCPTYPPYLMVPAQVTDEDLVEVARYRHFGRIPSVVWRYRKNGAVLVRSSQPSVGLLGRRSSHDERMLGAILESCIYDDLDDDDFFEINVCDQEHSLDLDGKPKDNAICSHNYCDNCINHCLNELRQLTEQDTEAKGESNDDDKTNRVLNECSLNARNKEYLSMQNTPETMNGSGPAIEQSLNQLRIELQADQESVTVDDETGRKPDESSDTCKSDSTQSSCRCQCHETIKRDRSESTLSGPNQAAERNKDKRLLILDARSFTVAFFNRAMGGGSECAEYYPNCDVDYLYLANIHSVRNAFLNLRSLCENNPVQIPN